MKRQRVWRYRMREARRHRRLLRLANRRIEEARAKFVREFWYGRGSATPREYGGLSVEIGERPVRDL